MAMNCIQAGTFFMTPTTLLPVMAADLGLSVGQAMLPLAAGKLAYVALLVPGGVLVDAAGPRAGVLGGIAGLAAVTAVYAVAVRGLWAMGVAHVALATFSSVSGVPVYSLFIAGWFGGGGAWASPWALCWRGGGGGGGDGVGGDAERGGVPSPVAPASLGEEGTADAHDASPQLSPSVVGADGGMQLSPIAESAVAPSVDTVAPAATAADSDSGPATGGTAPTPPGGPVLFPTLPTDAATAAMAAAAAAGDAAAAATAAAAAASARRRTFLGFAASYALMQYTFGSLGENLLFFLTIDRGMPLSVASLYFSALNGCAFLAKLAGGHLGDRFNRFRIAGGASLLTAIGVSLLFASGSWAPVGAGDGVDGGGDALEGVRLPTLTASPWVVLAFTIVFGLGYGATFNCLYSLGPVVFGRRDLGRVQSALFGCGLLGNATGAVVSGALRTAYSTYDLPFLLAATACAANVLTFSATRRVCEAAAGERLRHADAAAAAAAAADAATAAAPSTARRADKGAKAVAPAGGDGGGGGGGGGGNGDGEAVAKPPPTAAEDTPLLGRGFLRHRPSSGVSPYGSGASTPAGDGAARAAALAHPGPAAAFAAALAATAGSPGGDGPAGRALLRASRSVSSSLTAAAAAAAAGGAPPSPGGASPAASWRVVGGRVRLSASRDSLLSTASSAARPPSGGGLFPAPLRRRAGGRTPVGESTDALAPARRAPHMNRSVSVDWLPPPGSRPWRAGGGGGGGTLATASTALGREGGGSAPSPPRSWRAAS
ncbi:hypothetical protein BU14_0190s0020 [Porphyra umbilicalis]|uniref:Uncharacterized protein n=1 Tax=Porphyra umbilicalis TaxID=2786 RepID=A0A1X6P758_PORUM|nr:hypothetical protein BU14_0190s0020 [Porphyra umbilicalis]|eukprot:OSX76463.1 hypothetical protein BU14_0190s0020 [Porphyra umbilicalis]